MAPFHNDYRSTVEIIIDQQTYFIEASDKKKVT